MRWLAPFLSAALLLASAACALFEDENAPDSAPAAVATARPLPPAVFSFEIVHYRGIDIDPPRGGTPVYHVDETVVVRARVQSIESLHIAIAWSASLTLLTLDIPVPGDGVIEVPVTLPKPGSVFTIYDRFQGKDVPFVLEAEPILIVEGWGVVAAPFAKDWPRVRSDDAPIVPFPVSYRVTMGSPSSSDR
jgi:hypothetical protein